MIVQVLGHISYKWLLKEENISCPIVNYAHSPNFPLVTEVLCKEFEEIYESYESYRNSISCNRPNVIRALPKPNSSIPALENSPHIWHWRDTETGIEFLMFSDGRRKNHYKGTSIEVLCNNHIDDAKLADAYSRLLEFVKQCYYEANEKK